MSAPFVRGGVYLVAAAWIVGPAGLLGAGWAGHTGRAGGGH